MRDGRVRGKDLMASRPVLLLGADGMLGRAMRAELDARGWRVIAPLWAELDLADPRSLERFRGMPLSELPWLLLNCAAWTDVDGAEAKEAEATEVNGEAIGR